MRRAIALILSIAAALSISATALAADISVLANPAELTEPGTVALTFTIRSTSDVDMTNFSISGYGDVSGGQELGGAVVQPGGALEFVLRNVEVGADMLGQPLRYTLTWQEAGEIKSEDVSVTVGSAAPATTELTAAREASKTAAAKGEKVTITYKLKNPSDAVGITDISLKDPIAGSSAIESGLSLAPGESKDIKYEYTVTDKDATSSPAFTYKVNGEEKKLALDPITITTVAVSMEVSVAVGENTPDGILFSIVLKNTGNQSINKVQVTDELGNKVNEDRFTLEAGKDRSLSYTVVTEELRNVSFTITGTDALGQPYENKTKSYEAWPYVDSSLVSLSLVATVLEPLTEDGRMKVRFAVQNNSSVDLTGAIISEEQLGELQTKDTLPLGETLLEQELQVGGPRELVFTLSAQDPSGARHAYQARLTADFVALATPVPEESTPAPEEEEAPADGGGLSGTLMTVLIVLAALMAVAGIALLVLSIYEKRNNARVEEDDGIDTNAPVRFASQEGQIPAQPRPNAVRRPGGMPPQGADPAGYDPRSEEPYPMREPAGYGHEGYPRSDGQVGGYAAQQPGYWNARPVTPPMQQGGAPGPEAGYGPAPVRTGPPMRAEGQNAPPPRQSYGPTEPRQNYAPAEPQRPRQPLAPRQAPPSPAAPTQPRQSQQPPAARQSAPAQPRQPESVQRPPQPPVRPVQTDGTEPHAHFAGRNQIRRIHTGDDE